MSLAELSLTKKARASPNDPSVSARELGELISQPITGEPGCSLRKIEPTPQTSKTGLGVRFV